MLSHFLRQSSIVSSASSVLLEDRHLVQRHLVGSLELRPASCAAASRTSSLPVTTSAIRRVRYSRRSAISRLLAAQLPRRYAAVCSRESVDDRVLFIEREEWRASDS